MWIISLGFSISLFVLVCFVYLKRRKKPNVLYRTIVRLPFELIPFVFSMFTIVLSLDYVGVTSRLGKALSVADSTYLFGALSVLVSNIINNIPMSVFFSSILDNVTLVGNEYLKVVLACVAGSNIGAYLTPVGALAGIMWSSILKLYGIKFSFKDFIKYGFIVAVPALIAALAGIEIIL
jgi:arsenical pump membrane protein